MNDLEFNPFQVLYVTDSPDPRTFVELFSAFPIQHVLALFQPGNVILRGTQGAGKSMLLNLLKPEIRLAYHTANEEFPLPKHLRRFIGAGMNLTRSGALDIGQRPIGDSPAHDEALFPLYFADFINYFIVRDILRSVGLMAERPEAFDGLVDASRLDDFAEILSREDCWFGYLNDHGTFTSLCQGIDLRIASYRAFHQYNSALSSEIGSTKTSIGEAIGRVEQCLKRAGAIAGTTPIYVRIDQIERLYRSDVLRPSLGLQYRRVINKAIGMRDSRISYRIGTRTYAWDDDLTIYGTQDRLEHIRDFRIITLDELLRRGENTKAWIFPQFVEDTFRKRIHHADREGALGNDLIDNVFGAQARLQNPSDVAKQYVRAGNADRVLGLNESWAESWREFLRARFDADPVTAMLAAAWARQGDGARKGNRLKEPPPIEKAPWNREYWRKERIRQCLLQIAARSAQRLKWTGTDSILRLSGGNISIFLSICHEIWDVFIRANRRKAPHSRQHPLKDGIDPDLQSVGIYTASVYWFSKISEQPKGDDRQRFVSTLGSKFRTWLVDDASMSYPGHNGFSVANEELDHYPAVRRFLRDAADYGDLFEAPHTTKERDRRPRTKWYVSPVLSPFFQIPEVRTKEPFYARIEDVLAWLAASNVVLPGLDLTQIVPESARAAGVDDSQRFLPFGEREA